MMTGTLRLAIRNLGRNRRRTVLSVIGVGVGCAIALTVSGFRTSIVQVYSRLAAEAGPGHLRVSPPGWLPQREVKLRLEDGEAVLSRVRALEKVTAAAPRARVQSLLAMGVRVAAVELVGVDPITEPRADRAVRKVVKGRYLVPDDGDVVVIGQALADQLQVDVDDELVVTVMGLGGDMQSAMLRIAGVVTGGSRTLDATIAQVPLAVVQRLSGIPGIGEIAVMLDDFESVEPMRPVLQRASGANGVLSWDQVSAELSGHLKQDEAMSRIMSGFVIFVVLLGVAAAQLTAVLERKREFAVFAAVGMRPWRLLAQIMLEAFALGVLGALAGVVLAAPGLTYLTVTGLDLSSVLSSEMVFEGVSMDPIIKARIGWWMVPYLLELAMAATLIGAIYPAIFAARTDPATALRSAA